MEWAAASQAAMDSFRHPMAWEALPAATRFCSLLTSRPLPGAPHDAGVAARREALQVWTQALPACRETVRAFNGAFPVLVAAAVARFDVT